MTRPATARVLRRMSGLRPFFALRTARRDPAFRDGESKPLPAIILRLRASGRYTSLPAQRRLDGPDDASSGYNHYGRRLRRPWRHRMPRMENVDAALEYQQESVIVAITAAAVPVIKTTSKGDFACASTPFPSATTLRRTSMSSSRLRSAVSRSNTK